MAGKYFVRDCKNPCHEQNKGVLLKQYPEAGAASMLQGHSERNVQWRL